MNLVLLIIIFVFLGFLYIREGLRFTRGQSRDLRGDPCIIRPTYMPFNMSPTAGLSKLYNPGVPYCDELYS